MANRAVRAPQFLFFHHTYYLTRWSVGLMLVRAASDLKKQHGLDAASTRRAEFWTPADVSLSTSLKIVQF